MYQWTESKNETKKTKNGVEKVKTEYKYEQRWSSSTVNSNTFKMGQGHVNTNWDRRFEKAKFSPYNLHLKLGDFNIPDNIFRKFCALRGMGNI
jgi:hypothetical protein